MFFFFFFNIGKTGRYRGNTGGNSRVDVESKYCLACPQGTYSDVTGLMVCDDCSKGKYQSGTCTKDEPDGGPAGGCIRCKACPAGQYSDQSKQSSCKQCDAGKSNGNVGSQAENNCEICAGGKFSENDGSTSCDLCPAGYISLVGGTANDHDDCSACTPGKYAASDGASTCSDCDPGKYASENHETSCSFCQSGQETDKGANKGGSRCVTCLKGNFEDVRSSCYCHCF